MPAPFSSAPCFTTPDAVLVDGANGICRRPAPATDSLSVATIALSVAFVLAAFTVLSHRRAALHARTWGLALAALFVTFVPGLWALSVRRADAPTRVVPTAAAVRALETQMEAFGARYQGCVEIDASACEACSPVARYALPRVDCVTRRGRIVLGASSLGGACVAHGDTLTCGGASP